MKIAIFGSGGVGGYFGAKLAKSGEDVVFIARGQQLRAMQEHGLRVESPDGDFVLDPINTTDDPSQVGLVDLVIPGVKAWQVPEVAQSMLPMIGADTIVMPLQNGVEAVDQLSKALGRTKVIGGLCQIISFVVAPGVIRHAGYEPKVVIGEQDNNLTERVEAVRDVFIKAVVNIKIAPDIQAAIWAKFLFIAAYSGMGSVTRVTAGRLRSQSETRELLEGAMREIFEVARARNIALPDDAVQIAMANVDSLPEDGTSSMQRDIIAGRPSELSAQNGAVARLGREVDVQTPINSFIYSCLLPSELIARGDVG